MAKFISFEEQIRKEMQREELKQFRHKMATLKKAKLWKGDARSVKPTKHYKGLVKQFADVISGKVKAVNVPAYCPASGCRTVKVRGKTVALVNVENYNTPRVKPTKQGFNIFDSFFGKKKLDVLTNTTANDLLNMSDDEKKQFKREFDANESLVFILDDKYMGYSAFQSIDKLLDALQGYVQTGMTGDTKIKIQIMNDSDITTYQKKQRIDTASARANRVKHRPYRNKRTPAGAARKRAYDANYAATKRANEKSLFNKLFGG